MFWGSKDTGWIGWSSTDPPSSLHPPPCKMARTEDVSDLARIETYTDLQVWPTNEIEHCSPYNTAVCPNCGLIAVFCLHVRNYAVPSVLLRKLTPGKSTVNEVRKCTLQLPKNITPDPDNIDEFSMMIFPKECEQGVCGCHHLLVHYKPEHMLSLHLVPAELSCVSELSTVMLPTEFSNWTGYLRPCVCSSTDGSVVAFANFGANKYHVWEPESGRVVSVCFPPNLRLHYYSWLATGKLYSIIVRCKRHITVIGTYTGEILLNDKYDCDVFPPADQSWLSTFVTPEHLPIAILCQRTGSWASLGSIIGRRSV